jgi:hypothetical protein
LLIFGNKLDFLLKNNFIIPCSEEKAVIWISSLAKLKNIYIYIGLRLEISHPHLDLKLCDLWYYIKAFQPNRHFLEPFGKAYNPLKITTLRSLYAIQHVHICMHTSFVHFSEPMLLMQTIKDEIIIIVIAFVCVGY